MGLRGRSFMRNLETFKSLSKNIPKNVDTSNGRNLAVINVGAPCCGVNAAVRSYVRTCISDGNNPFGIKSGFDGLIRGDLEIMTWEKVDGWVSQGGALLGTKRTLPNADNFGDIAVQLQKYKIEGLMIIGGFEAYQACLALAEHRAKYPVFCMPIAVLPATISNNVPGTEFSLGADTAQGTKRRVFIIETMGGYCGYLASMAGLAGGSDAAYIHEEQVGIKDLMEDLEVMANKIKEGKVERGLILRNEKANENYTTDFIFRLYSEEGKDRFTVRQNILGHMQQGGSPSPFDRNFGTKMGVKVYKWILEKLSEERKITPADKDTACLLGLRTRVYQFTPVEDLKPEVDFTYRRWKRQWWLQIRSIMRILAMHRATYDISSIESKMVGVDEYNNI